MSPIRLVEEADGAASSSEVKTDSIRSLWVIVRFPIRRCGRTTMAEAATTARRSPAVREPAERYESKVTAPR